MQNIDKKVVDDFGFEWDKFDHSELSENELKEAFEQYFGIFPLEELNKQSTGFDMGCGSGRWAKMIANRVGTLNCIDPSEKAIEVAKKNLAEFSNINFITRSVDNVEIDEQSQDFGFCLGVLHHVPDTLGGIKSCSKLLKKGAPFLIYLYYNFENKPMWFQFVWRITDVFRRFICILPLQLKVFLSALIALFIYYPLARLSKNLARFGVDVSNIPLQDYRNKAFYFMRNDALDRFGTRLEKRFTKLEIKSMLEDSDFENIQFSDSMPHWVCIARKV